MINLIWSGLLAVLLLSGCGWNGTPTRSPEGLVPLTSIQIVAISPVIEVSRTIAAGTSTKFTAYGFYSGVRVDITDQVAWSSDSPVVAEFKYPAAPNKNRVTGTAAGSAILSASLGGITGTYSLTVSTATVATMTITPVNPSLAKGLTTQFTVSGIFSDATTQDLTFDATWSPAPGTFATVSNDAASKGLATALSVGVETITATFGGIPTSSTTTLTVTPAVLQSITVTPANSSIAGFNKAVNFTATGTYSDATTADITTTVTWASSLPGVATIVAGSGVATTVAAGTTSITATLGVSGSTNLTVTALVLKANGLQITPASPITLKLGTPQQLTVTATFNDSSTQNVSASSVWASSVPTVASVITNTGLVTGITFGTTIITVTYGGQSVAATVNVTP